MNVYSFEGKLIMSDFNELHRLALIESYPQYVKATAAYLNACLGYTSCDSELYAKDNEGWIRG